MIERIASIMLVLLSALRQVASKKHPAWAETLKHMYEFQQTHGSNYFKDIIRWNPQSCVRRQDASANSKTLPTLWLIGNSVSRIHFFAALALLNDGHSSNVTIPEQITQCGKGGDWKGRRPGQGTSCLGPCSCSDKVPGLDMKVVFVWQQQVWDRTLHSSLTGGQFSPNQSPIRPGDVVLLNSGMEAVSVVFKRAYGGKKYIGADGRVINIKGNYSFFAAIWRQALARESEQLAESVAAAWRGGRRVFWRTSTPDCHPSTRSEFVPHLKPGKPAWEAMTSLGFQSVSQWWNSMVRESDSTVREALTRRGLPVLDMVEVDKEANRCRERLANARNSEEALLACRCDGFVDHTWYHPGPLLASRQVALLLALTDASCSARRPKK